MKSKKETFAGLLQNFQYHFDTWQVFEDFLTLTVCAFGHNPRTGTSYDENLYLQTMAKYKHHDLGQHFPKMLGALVIEMEERLDSSNGNDVLGEYYEQHFRKKGLSQFFTPWCACKLMAAVLLDDSIKASSHIIDPCCGSGRLLLSSAQATGREHRYFGIDIDHTCVKMTALNLFLNGVFHAEIMWADALSPDDFRASYMLSFLPFGIFRITEKEHSYLWHAYRETYAHKHWPAEDLTLPSGDGASFSDGSQLILF